MSAGPSDPAKAAAAAKSKETRERNSSNANFVAFVVDLCSNGNLDTQTVTTMLRAAVKTNNTDAILSLLKCCPLPAGTTFPATIPMPPTHKDANGRHVPDLKVEVGFLTAMVLQNEEKLVRGSKLLDNLFKVSKPDMHSIGEALWITRRHGAGSSFFFIMERLVTALVELLDDQKTLELKVGTDSWDGWPRHGITEPLAVVPAQMPLQTPATVVTLMTRIGVPQLFSWARDRWPDAFTCESVADAVAVSLTMHAEAPPKFMQSWIAFKELKLPRPLVASFDEGVVVFSLGTLDKALRVFECDVRDKSDANKRASLAARRFGESLMHAYPKPLEGSVIVDLVQKVEFCTRTATPMAGECKLALGTCAWNPRIPAVDDAKRRMIWTTMAALTYVRHAVELKTHEVHSDASQQVCVSHVKTVQTLVPYLVLLCARLYSNQVTLWPVRNVDFCCGSKLVSSFSGPLLDGCLQAFVTFLKQQAAFPLARPTDLPGLLVPGETRWLKTNAAAALNYALFMRNDNHEFFNRVFLPIFETSMAMTLNLSSEALRAQPLSTLAALFPLQRAGRAYPCGAQTAMECLSGITQEDDASASARDRRDHTTQMINAVVEKIHRKYVPGMSNLGYFAESPTLKVEFQILEAASHGPRAVMRRYLDCVPNGRYLLPGIASSAFWPAVVLQAFPETFKHVIDLLLERKEPGVMGSWTRSVPTAMVNEWMTRQENRSALRAWDLHRVWAGTPRPHDFLSGAYKPDAVTMYRVAIATRMLTDLWMLHLRNERVTGSHRLPDELLERYREVHAALVVEMLPMVPWHLALTTFTDANCNATRVTHVHVVAFARLARLGPVIYRRVLLAYIYSVQLIVGALVKAEKFFDARCALNNLQSLLSHELLDCDPARGEEEYAETLWHSDFSLRVQWFNGSLVQVNFEAFTPKSVFKDVLLHPRFEREGASDRMKWHDQIFMRRPGSSTSLPSRN